MIGIIKHIIGALISLYYHLTYKLIPCDDKTVLFLSFHGRGFTDNPKAIYEYMHRQPAFQDYQLVWAIKNHKKKNIAIEGAKVIEYLSLSYFYYLARSKYWIVNCKLPDYLVKKPEQIYLQTWHGTPLKRLGHDIQVDPNAKFYRSKMSAEEMKKTYDIDVSRYTYMISPNRFCTEVFPSAFGIDEKRLIQTGYPRNDFITNATAADVKRIKQAYGIPEGKKVILYAPTWRDNSYMAAGYTFELKADFHEWKNRLGDDYVVVFKPHYLIINRYEGDHSLDGFLYSISANAEINELYVIADVLVTDYSSVFFDYAVLERPIYFYMYDLKEYQEELRGFYLDIHQDLPGAIYEEEKSLLHDIHEQVYDKQVLKTFNERFNADQTGNCAQKVVDIVFQDALGKTTTTNG